MSKHKERIEAFLRCRVFAVAGVSGTRDLPGNHIFEKLQKKGHKVFALNPHLDTWKGEKVYKDLSELPERVEAVVIATAPEQAMGIVADCHQHGVEYVWFHRSVNGGSFEKKAADLANGFGLKTIEGGCPMMHLKPVDPVHFCMKWVLQTAGKIPK